MWLGAACGEWSHIRADAPSCKYLIIMPIADYCKYIHDRGELCPYGCREPPVGPAFIRCHKHGRNNCKYQLKERCGFGWHITYEDYMQRGSYGSSSKGGGKGTGRGNGHDSNASSSGPSPPDLGPSRGRFRVDPTTGEPDQDCRAGIMTRSFVACLRQDLDEFLHPTDGRSAPSPEECVAKRRRLYASFHPDKSPISSQAFIDMFTEASKEIGRQLGS